MTRTKPEVVRGRDEPTSAATEPLVPDGNTAVVALPPDPEAFVHRAEVTANRRDLRQAVAAYAADAVLETITDGVYERFHGSAAIRRAWDGYLDGMEARGFRVKKRLLTASGDTIVSDFVGGFATSDALEGVDIWRFDAGGRVVEHRMLTFLHPRPSDILWQRFLFGIAYPVTGLAFLRSARRAGASDAARGRPQWGPL